MSDENQSQESQAEKHMASVKASWDKAPEGSKKDAALKHYEAAQKAQEADDEDTVHRELKEASRVLM
ncbi:hypothetical protein [uncultured Jannaschia sp.]|uniref:hypothetical protein n=1 Tax=uncultured Jannaschia sp. TaxID=293347 RepID=UPI00261020B4|nr:hypothetical protein [uncultured Jannaschia sp.]